MTRLSLPLVGLAMFTLIAPVVTAQRGPVDKGPGTLAAARKYLEGNWRLVSFEVIPPGKAAIPVNGRGSLTYDGYGNLDMQITADKASAALLDAAGIQTQNGVLMSKGKAVINMQQRSLTYLIEGQPPVGAPSGPLGLNRPRYWEVDGTTLTLTTKDDAGKPLSIGKWEKQP
jgi:hypothetical protein